MILNKMGMNNLNRDQKYAFVRLYANELFTKKKGESGTVCYSKKVKNSIYEVVCKVYKDVFLYDVMPLHELVNASKSFDIIDREQGE